MILPDLNAKPFYTANAPHCSELLVDSLFLKIQIILILFLYLIPAMVINDFRLQLSVDTIQRMFYKTMLRPFPFSTKRFMTSHDQNASLSFKICLHMGSHTSHASCFPLHSLACPSPSIITHAGVPSSRRQWLLFGQVTDGVSEESGLRKPVRGECGTKDHHTHTLLSSKRFLGKTKQQRSSSSL